MSTAPFRLTGVRVTLGGEPVLHDVNLAISQGSFVAVLGENGSGKSTLLRTMLGLIPTDTGEVRIYDTPVRQFSEWKRVAFVPQHLISAGAVPVSVQEVVMTGLIGPHSRFSWARDRDAIRTALESVELWTRRHDAVDTLSGGQQRRVLIAAALAKGADTLLLDEPTAGVDAESVGQLVSTLRTLSENGKTIVLVTHELGPMEDLATRCIVLGTRNGPCVLYDGPAPAPANLRDPDGHHDPAAPDRDIWGLSG